MDKRAFLHNILDHLERNQGNSGSLPMYLNVDTGKLEYYNSQEPTYYNDDLKIKGCNQSILRYIGSVLKDKPKPQEGLICVTAYLLASLREAKLLSLTPEELTDIKYRLENLIIALSREENLRIKQWIRQKRDEINQLE